MKRIKLEGQLLQAKENIKSLLKAIKADENTVGVYDVIVTNNAEDEFDLVEYHYIGSGFLKDRMNGNFSKLINNKHDNKKIQQAFNTYNNVEVELIKVCDSDEEARQLEQQCFKQALSINTNDYILTNVRLKSENDCTRVTYNKHNRLNAEQVAEIKYLYDAIDISMVDLAEKYDCSLNTIKLIIGNHRWQNVEPLEF